MKNKLKEYLDRYGITQAELVKKSGISAKTISRAYNRGQEISDVTKNKIVLALIDIAKDIGINPDINNFHIDHIFPKSQFDLGENWTVIDGNTNTLEGVDLHGVRPNIVNREPAKFNTPVYLKVEVEIPDHISDEKAKEYVAELMMKLDNLHRAKGGKGLKVRDLQIAKEEVLENILA